MYQNDKAYYLNNIELALVLSLKGMKELYGFRMKHVQNPDPTLVYQAIFDLKRESMLSVEKSQDHERERLIINPELDQILDEIMHAKKMLLYFNRQSEYPDRCIYLGNKAVCITACGMTGNMNRLNSLSVGNLPETVYEFGFYIEELLSDESIYKEQEIENPLLQKVADDLFDKELSTLDTKAWGGATDCLKLISIESRKCISQYLLIKDGLNDYFSVTDKMGSHIFMYSKKKVLDTLESIKDNI